MAFKDVPFFPNEPDNNHCLQSCVKSVLSFYFPKKVFSTKTIENKTIFNNGWSWLPPSVCWLNELGLKVKLYSKFDYLQFADMGEMYLKEFKREAFEIEKRNGSYQNINTIQKYSNLMINNHLWVYKKMEIENLCKLLSKPNTLAIAKTVYQFLDGSNPNTVSDPVSHYIIIIKEYNYHQLLIHDCGLPPKPNRKIAKNILFGDILLISSY